MEKQTLDTTNAVATDAQIAGDEFQLDMVDFGSAYQAAEAIDIACMRCYCGSGCLCGCLSQ